MTCIKLPTTDAKGTFFISFISSSLEENCLKLSLNWFTIGKQIVWTSSY
jgi:hypothetical protein